MIERNVTVKMPCGLHLRPARILSDAASRYKAKGYILYKTSVIDVKSILNLVSQGINVNDEIKIRCIGPEEKALMEKLIEIFEDSTMKA
ncbi:MAG: HPr family phosphocarrier protein [Lachnospiraceae bacterium]